MRVAGFWGGVAVLLVVLFGVSSRWLRRYRLVPRRISLQRAY